MNESQVQAQVRLIASQRGWRLWRNNTGVATDPRGVPVRFGLANDSPQMNKLLKSSDLIGLTNTGRFVAIECKASDWKYTGTPREVAQFRFIKMVNDMGGYAKFLTDPAAL